MKVTLESVEKNKVIYDENIKKIIEQRAELMKQVSELRRKKEISTDEIDIAELDFEESQLIQQINDLTAVFKSNKLTLEQLGIQQDRLKLNIDQATYSNSIVANRKAKADLFKEQELEYCENEVTKCEKALRLYTLTRDSQNIEKWSKALEKAQNDLLLAQKELDKDEKTQPEKTGNENQQKETSHINEYYEIIRPNNAQKNVDTKEHYTGYAFEERDGIYIEKWDEVLKDDSGKEIGNRTTTELEEIGKGKTIKSVGEIENDAGKYSMKEVSEGLGDEYSVLKEIKGYNKLTGNNEQFSYSKDKAGNEFAYSMINGKKNLRVSKTSRGTTIERYDENGNIQDTFEYDKDGKAIIEFQGMDEIQEDYVEKFFERISRNVPEYYAEGIDRPTQDKGKDTKNLFKTKEEIISKKESKESEAKTTSSMDDDFFRSLNSMTNSIEEQVQNMKIDMNEELEQGSLGKEENTKKKDDKVERTDDDFIW